MVDHGPDEAIEKGLDSNFERCLRDSGGEWLEKRVD